MERDESIAQAAELDRIGIDLADEAARSLWLRPRVEPLRTLQGLLAVPGTAPVVVGEPGVGKSALLRVLARSLLPSTALPMAHVDLRGMRIIEVDPIGLAAGALFANHLEHKLDRLVANCQKRRAILCFDDLAALLGTGASAQDPTDVLGLLLPHVRRGSLRIVGATSLAGWTRVSQMLPNVARALTPLTLEPATHEETLAMLADRVPHWRRKTGAIVSDDALLEACDLSERLFPWKKRPGSAAELLDVALSTGVRGGAAPPPPRRVDASDLASAVSSLTGVPRPLLDPYLPLDRASLRETLATRVVGQDHVLDPIVDRLLMVKARLCAPERPLCTYLLAGPSGVGKTSLARAISAAVLGDESRLVRFDMSELCTVDDVSRFVGEMRPRPGRIGLVDAVLAQPFPVILLDEIEKAHRAILDVLLQTLGEGRLTSEGGRTAYFQNAIVLMTSNLGSGRRTISHPGGSEREREQAVRAAVRQHFRPELVNRLTDVFVFRPLGREHASTIARRAVNTLITRHGLAGRFDRVRVARGLLERVVAEGYSPDLGARPMERAVERLVGTAIARLLASTPSARGGSLVLGLADDETVHAQVVATERAAS